MQLATIAIVVLVSVVLTLGLESCASYRTIATADRDTPKVFSGTRLDLHAGLSDDRGLRQFKTEPPSYPWLDLPLSLLADAAVFPLSSSVALYEVVFE